jgi:hypothetical protein
MKIEASPAKFFNVSLDGFSISFRKSSINKLFIEFLEKCCFIFTCSETKKGIGISSNTDPFACYGSCASINRVTRTIENIPYEAVADYFILYFII